MPRRKPIRTLAQFNKASVRRNRKKAERAEGLLNNDFVASVAARYFEMLQRRLLATSGGRKENGFNSIPLYFDILNRLNAKRVTKFREKWIKRANASRSRIYRIGPWIGQSALHGAPRGNNLRAQRSIAGFVSDFVARTSGTAKQRWQTLKLELDEIADPGSVAIDQSGKNSFDFSVEGQSASVRFGQLQKAITAARKRTKPVISPNVVR